MLTKKNFKAIAGILKGFYQDKTTTESQKSLIAYLVREFCLYFKRENPNFNSAKFEDEVFKNA